MTIQEVVMQTEVEQKAATEKFNAMANKLSALSEEERFGFVDMGFANDVIRGYLIEAMKFADADFTREDIESALNGLKWSFDSTTAEEAAAVWQQF